MSAVKTLAHVRDAAESTGEFNLKGAFAQFDVDGDGSISHEELSTILLSLIPGLAYDEILDVIHLFDPNNDGEISYFEFAHTFYTSEDYDHKAKARMSMVKIRKMASSKKGFNLREAFQRFDTDGDGTVSHDELKVVINDILQGDVTEQEMADVIKLFDPDDDGSISYREFNSLFYSISVEDLSEKVRVVCEFVAQHSEQSPWGDAEVEAKVVPGLMRDEFIAVKLSMNNITDEGVNELCGALSDDKSHCEVIDLRSNAFGSLAAQKLGVALGTNIYVQELFLSHNDIGGEGAAALCASLAPTNAGFSAISVLDLRHCGIDDAGAERLGKSLVGNTALKTVSFCGNRIGDRGGGAIGAALQNERCMIKNMNLSNNMIGEEGAKLLGYSLRANRECTSFILSGNVAVGDVGVSAFAETLEGVSDYDDDDDDDDDEDDGDNDDPSQGKGKGKGKSKIKGKNKSKSKRGGNRLSVLGLAGCGMSDAGAIDLCGSLRTNDVLTTLDIRSNEFGDDGAVAIGRSLEENTALRQLYMGNNDLGKSAATALGAALAKNVSLLVLDVSGTDLSKANAGLLAEGLHDNEALLELNISRSKIDDEGLKCFQDAVEANQVLDKLLFHSNPLTLPVIAAMDFALSRERKPAANILDNMEAKRVKRKKMMKLRAVSRNMTVENEAKEEQVQEKKKQEVLEPGVTIFVPVSFGRRNNIVGKLSIDSTTTLQTARERIHEMGDLGDDFVFMSCNDGKPIPKVEEGKRQVIWDSGKHVVLRPDNWIEL
ncbi:hypothetical protein ScalyP_jg11608 [Parmales sp. scaly parma]|nr:hypothetical protein ScalyP_jg11608 [Parmales sp. scaly parma]